MGKKFSEKWKEEREKKRAMKKEKKVIKHKLFTNFRQSVNQDPKLT